MASGVKSRSEICRIVDPGRHRERSEMLGSTAVVAKETTELAAMTSWGEAQICIEALRAIDASTSRYLFARAASMSYTNTDPIVRPRVTMHLTISRFINPHPTTP